MTQVSEAIDVRCRCDDVGREVERGYYGFHWSTNDRAEWSFQCLNHADEEDGLCGWCRVGHPERGGETA